MQVYHTFETLSEADSGKQHKFNWYTDDGTFVCHAMYQSGSDSIALTAGGTAPRGKVLRLQFDEQGKTLPGQGIAIQVDAEKWQEKDFAALADSIQHTLKNNRDHQPLGSAEKTAVLCQLSSLYNLMATRYGDVFLGEEAVPVKIPRPADERGLQSAIDSAITSSKMTALSDWAGKIALHHLDARNPAPDALRLPSDHDLSGKDASVMLWHHDITAKAGAKTHVFAFEQDGSEITAAIYRSGDAGERVGIQQRRIHPDKTPRQKPEAFDIKTGADSIPPGPVFFAPGTVIAPEMNAHKIQEAMNNNEITKEQAAAAFMMLASVYRLAATRYNGPFGYDWNGEKLGAYLENESPLYGKKIARAAGKAPTKDLFVTKGKRFHRPVHIHDAESLSNYIREPESEAAARQCIRFAAESLLEKPLNLPSTVEMGMGMRPFIDYSQLPSGRQPGR